MQSLERIPRETYFLELINRGITGVAVHELVDVQLDVFYLVLHGEEHVSAVVQQYQPRVYEFLGLSSRQTLARKVKGGPVDRHLSHFV